MRRWFILAALLGVLALAITPASAGAPADLGPALAAQARYTDALLGNPDVVGTAVGLTPGGEPAVLVLTRRAGAGGVPAKLDGVPVVIHVTGDVSALNHSPGHQAAKGTKIDPKKRFARPVPIGVSTGNAKECSAGTIGARVKADTSVFALSNNHVYARENKAAIGEEVLQPGLYDTGCAYDSNNHLGNLSAFKAIDFSGGDNTIDAAIAASTTGDLGNATPSNGYGLPKTATVAAFVGQNVQKYGRTTSLTKGQVVGINSTVNVNYGDSGTATFVGQVLILGNKPFAKAGDSGSLIVSSARNPVALLFAGSVTGYVWGNPIDLVLAEFAVAVDGE